MPSIWRNAWKYLRKHIRLAVRSLQERRFAPGKRIAGRYTVVRKLGMGSYGVAYLCKSADNGAMCVLKRVFPLNGGSARTKKIYSREMEILQRLDHPATPKLLDRFRFRGQSCLVMEYVAGDTLDELLFRDHRRFSEEESLRLLLDLLDVVEYLHSKRIIHRDISIGNVMLQDGRVRLIDFGLSALLDERDPAAVVQAPDVDRDDPMEKKLSRAVHVSSDFYAMGHLLLFLLYSTFESPADREEPRSEPERGWETELKLHPLTRKLLRRLLQADEPYDDVGDVIAFARRILLQAGFNRGGG